MEVGSNQPLEWGEIVDLPEDQLRVALSASQQQVCHQVITLLYESITSETKPLKDVVSKIVRCLPEEAAGDSTLPKILDYMNDNGSFYTAGSIWNFYQNVPDPQLITKIKTSIIEGNGKFALELLNHGFPLGSDDVKECLLLASAEGETALVSKLLDLGTESVVQSKKEWRMFTMMPDFDDLDNVVKMDSNIKDERGNTPLELAILHRHEDTAAILLEYSIPQSHEALQNLLLLASAEGLESIVTRILDLGEEINRAEAEYLQEFLAASEEPIGVNIKGLKFDADFADTSGNTPLHLACMNGHRAATAILIERGSDINARDNENNTPLLIACMQNYTDIALQLIENGANVKADNHSNHTAATRALWNENKVLLLKLVEKGAVIDLESPPEFLRDALKESILSGNTALALGLLKNSFPVDANMLLLACQKGLGEVALELLKHGHIDFKDEHNNSPLHMACENNLATVVMALIEKGADYNTVNDNGDSPVHMAIRHEHEELESIFIAHKIDINSIKWEEELKRISGLNAAIGKRIASELAGKSKDSDEAKIIFSLTKLLKEIKKNNLQLPEKIQIDPKGFIHSLTFESGKDFFPALEREIHSLQQKMQKRQFEAFSIIAKEVGGEQFQRDFEEVYIRNPAFDDFASGATSVVKHPFFTASPEEKMKMVLQSKAFASKLLSQSQFDILFSELESSYKTAHCSFEEFYQKISLLLATVIEMSTAQGVGDILGQVVHTSKAYETVAEDYRKMADRVIQRLFPQLLHKIDTDLSVWMEPLTALMKIAGGLNTEEREFAPEVIADVLVQFAEERGFPEDVGKFRAAAADSNAARYLELLCEKSASNETYAESNTQLWRARISEKLEGRDFQQHLFERFFTGAVEAKKCDDICDGLVSCYELAKRFNQPPLVFLSGYLRYIDKARSYAFPGGRAILACSVEQMTPVKEWQAALAKELPNDNGAKAFLQLLQASGFYPITEDEIKTVSALYKKGLESLQNDKVQTEAAKIALAEGCVALLKEQRASYLPLEVPKLLRPLYYAKIPVLEGWEQKIESSLLLQEMRVHHVRGPVSVEELQTLNRYAQLIKSYPADVAAIAIRRYVQSCQAQNIFLKGSIPKETVFAFCFEATIEKMLGSQPKEKKEAVIALFNTMSGKGIPLSKEGQRRLVFLAAKTISPLFAGGRSLTHPRVIDKFPDILGAIGLSHVANLNGFAFDELLGEMFDEQQAYLFKNINAKELLDATIAQPERAILSVATPAISSLLGGKELDDDTKQCIQELANGLRGVLYDKMQNLKGKVDETRAVEFDIEVSTKGILSGVLEGVVRAMNGGEETPSFVQKLIRNGTNYIFNPSGQGSEEVDAKSHTQIRTDRKNEGWGEWGTKTLMRGLGSTAGSYLVSKIANVGLPYLINQEIAECERQISVKKFKPEESIAFKEELKLLELQLDLLKCLGKMSPQLSALAVKILNNLLDTIDKEKTSGLIYDWMSYDDAQSIDSKTSNSTEAAMLKYMAKEKIAEMLYASTTTLLTEGQNIFSGLFEGVLSGIKTIPSFERGPGPIQVPMPPTLQEPRSKETVEQAVKMNKERFISITTKTLTPLYWSSDKDKIVSNQLLPQLTKEFEAVFTRDPALGDDEIREVCKLVDVGYGLIEKGYTVQEIAIGCRRCCEEQMRSGKPVTSVEQEKLLPFVFDGVVESLTEEILRSGKARVTAGGVGADTHLKEKVLFYLNHTRIGSSGALLNGNGKAALKEMITTLFLPQFCEGKQLLSPLILERFHLILQGTNLSDVNLLNAQNATQRTEIRKNMIVESELCLKKINVGMVKNAITHHPEECMTSVANSAINVLTKGVAFKEKQKHKEITNKLIATFTNTSLIQDFLTKAKFELDNFSFQGVDIEAHISLEPLANELKKASKKVSESIQRGELPRAEISVDSGLVAPALRALVDNFDKAQSSRTSMMQGERLEAGSGAAEIVKILEELKGDALGVQGKAISMAMGMVLKFPETAKEAFKSPELLKALSTMVKPIVVATAFAKHEKLIKELTAKQQKEGLTAEEEVVFSLTKKVLDNKRDVVDLLCDMVIETLLQMDDIQDIVRLLQYIADFASDKSMKIDTLRLSELLVKSLDVVLSNISIFREVIPTVMGSVASAQKYGI